MPQWVDILKRVGYPTDVVVLDFESYFSSIYKMGSGGLSTTEYVMDKRFEEIGLASVRWRGTRPDLKPVAEFDHDVAAVLSWLQKQYGPQLHRCTVVSHNARFDGAILAWHHGIVPPYYIDTLGLAMHINSRTKNNLASLCKRYGLPDKGDTSQFKGLHWEPVTRWEKRKGCMFSLPVTEPGMNTAQRKAMEEYAINDVEQEWDLFTLLLPELSNPYTELQLMQHTLEIFWRPTLRVDFDRGEQLAVDMRAEMDRIVEPLGISVKDIGGTISFERILREALGDEEPPMKQGKLKPILAIAKGDEGLEYLLHHEKKQVRDLISARCAVKSWPLHIGRVKRIMAQAKAANGPIPVPLHYHGASTGRWSGGERINLHNLGKRSVHQLIRDVRKMLVAPPDHSLVVADAAQIEARGTDWIAGQSDMVDAWAAGRPIYCDFASGIVGRTVRKPRADDPPPVASKYKFWRALGKVGVLGCGYGMGVDRCLDYAKNTYHIEIDRTMAKKVVNHYRGTHPMVCKFWKDLGYAFSYVVRYPHETTEMARGLRFHNRDDCVFITLPNGRELRYHHVRILEGEKGPQLWMPDQRKPGAVVYMWGGYLTENIIQAMCRDVFGEAILRMEKRGLHVAHHVHDETIGVVPTVQAKEALALSIEELSRPVSWAPGLPLAAEGQVAERYGE